MNQTLKYCMVIVMIISCGACTSKTSSDENVRMKYIHDSLFSSQKIFGNAHGDSITPTVLDSSHTPFIVDTTPSFYVSVESKPLLKVNIGGVNYYLKDFGIYRQKDGDRIASLPDQTIKTLFYYRPHVRKRFFFDTTKYQWTSVVHCEEVWIGSSYSYKDTLWFGLAFYEGEGCEGVGGIGFYVPATGAIGLLHHPALMDVSTIDLSITDDTIYAKTVALHELVTTYGNGLVAISRADCGFHTRFPEGSSILDDKDDPGAINPAYMRPIADLIADRSLRASADADVWSALVTKDHHGVNMIRYMLQSHRWDVEGNYPAKQ